MISDRNPRQLKNHNEERAAPRTGGQQVKNPANDEPHGPTPPETVTHSQGKDTFEPGCGKVYEGHFLPERVTDPGRRIALEVT